MTKLYQFVGSVALMATLSSCGNYSGDFFGAFGDMEDSDEIAIIYNYPSSTCSSQSLLDSYKYDYPNSNIRISTESNSVTCASYGKSNDGYECSVYDAGYNSSSSCVIGIEYSSYRGLSDDNNTMVQVVEKALIFDKEGEK
jgi:hypothetical protein